MARCAIRAAFSSGAILRLARIPAPSFRRLTLRSATGQAQRASPTKNSVEIRPRHFQNLPLFPPAEQETGHPLNSYG
jgi:hypothetical protein